MGGGREEKMEGKESTLFLGAAPIRPGKLTRPHWFDVRSRLSESTCLLSSLVIGCFAATKFMRLQCYCRFMNIFESGH